MAKTLTLRVDTEIERALEILTRDGSSRSFAIRRAVIESAVRHRRGAAMRRAVLRMPPGEPDGVNVAAEIGRARGEER